MRKYFYIIISSLVFLVFACTHHNELRPSIKTSELEQISYRVIPFELSDVHLLEGPFKKAFELDKTYILNYSPDRLLARFRKEAGLSSKAEQYGGWESESLAGHTLGHYLTACAQVYASEADTVFLNRVNYIVSELSACQVADKDGYIGAFTDGKKIFTEEISKGDIRAQSFDLNGIWAPFYTMHKVMAGLRDAYRLCNNEDALRVESRFADWIYDTVNSLNDADFQEMLDCEHGGMNEVLAELYLETQDEKYLRLAKRFYHVKVLEPLSYEQDILPGIHGNTQIPKLIGLAKIFEIEGENSDSTASWYFWDRVVNHHSYTTGGHGNFEYFGHPDQLRDRLSDGTTETCNVYNMLKLSSHLFSWEPNSEVGDFYERALFNQILSTQSPVDGRLVYNQSLEMEGFKDFQNPNYFTCCIGSGMENHSKYNGNIYYHNNEEMYVSQFIASEVNWESKGIKLRQETSFPKEQATSLHIELENPVSFALLIRKPYWLADQNALITINNKIIDLDINPSGFYLINRKWENGDQVDISLPFSFRMEAMPDDQNRVSIMYGPLVMAGVFDKVNQETSSEFKHYIETMDRNPENWLELVDGRSLLFKTKGVGRPNDFEVMPLYQIYDRKYSAYLDVYTAEEHGAVLQSFQDQKEKEELILSKAIDEFIPGDSNNEKSHTFKGKDTEVVEYKRQKARHANRGGDMHLKMKVEPKVSNILYIKYWGGYTGSKTFDIVVDGSTIATENISGLKDGHFISIEYQIPKQLTDNKSIVDISFIPHTGHRAGPIFSILTIAKSEFDSVL